MTLFFSNLELPESPILLESLIYIAPPNVALLSLKVTDLNFNSSIFSAKIAPPIRAELFLKIELDISTLRVLFK